MISHVAVHFGLLLLSIIGVVQTVRVLRIAQRDMSALTASGANGPRRLIVLGRLNQSAFLLGAFGVLMAAGGRVALAAEYEIESPLVLTLIVSLDVVALLLALKEVTIRRNRSRVDAYYDQQQKAETLHAHRRSTDKPEMGK